jgi:hypothetical protein
MHPGILKEMNLGLQVFIPVWMILRLLLNTGLLIIATGMEKDEFLL